jgi:hypothetical protein
MSFGMAVTQINDPQKTVRANLIFLKNTSLARASGTSARFLLRSRSGCPSDAEGVRSRPEIGDQKLRRRSAAAISLTEVLAFQSSFVRN